MDLVRFRYFTRWHDYVNRQEYDASADPWKVLWMDPNDVEYFTIFSLEWGLGRVRGGDWDRRENCTRVHDIAIGKGLVQRFEEGYDWEETVYDDWAKDRLDDLDTFRGCTDIEEFREVRYSYLDSLFEDMREEGYRPNFETAYDSPEDIEFVHDMEPLVAIGRDGEILWSEGFHRLVLAQIINIDEIPVYVLRRHARWQKVREDIHAAQADDVPAGLEAHLDHPDLQDVTS